MIFETKRLLVRKLKIEDLEPFHELESNPKVLQYATGEVQTLEENEKSLKELINKYNLLENNFWIYAVVRKFDDNFIGTVALVKDENDDDEIGARFIENYWGNGYGFEVINGLIEYSKHIGIPKLIANVVDVNVASAKIIKRLNFKLVKKFIAEDIQLPETKYELIL